MPRFIKEDGISLPSFLFYLDDSKSKSISPAASFNPAAALDGQGFESSTSPSAKPQKRPIVFDKSALDHFLDYGERVAFIKRLKLLVLKFLFAARRLKMETLFTKLVII